MNTHSITDDMVSNLEENTDAVMTDLEQVTVKIPVKQKTCERDSSKICKKGRKRARGTCVCTK